MRYRLQSSRHIWFAVGILASLLVPPTPALGTFKGYRAVIFSGGTLREPVRVGDIEMATALYVSLFRGSAVPVDSIPLLSPRACIQVSAFVLRPQNENVRVEDLLPEYADFTTRLYLFEPGVMPVLSAGRTTSRMSGALVEELTALKVPTFSAEDRSATCPGRR